MKLLTLIATLVAVAHARPDVSHLPSGSYLPGQGGIGIDSSFTSGSSNFGQGGIATNFVGGGGSGNYNLGGNIGGGNFGGNIGGGNFGGNIGGGYQQDQKHVYFYAAPDDEQVSRFRINIAPSSQRNTKIIFVKAPSYGGVVPEVIAPPSLSEDKTLVYVLVKKPEQGGQITIPAGAGVKQTKPEVYFIKYKTQQDAQQQIQGGLQGQAVGSNIPDLGNEANFVRTLESSLKTGGGVQIHGSTGSDLSIQTGGGVHGPAGISGPY